MMDCKTQTYCPACGVAFDGLRLPVELVPGCERRAQLQPGDAACCDFCGCLLVFDRALNLVVMSDRQRCYLFKHRHKVFVALLTDSATSFLGRRRPANFDQVRWN
jgi:hypothetical protein